MALQPSEAIETQHMMADSFGLSLNQGTGSSLQTSHGASNFMDLSASHNMHNTHGTHNTHDAHHMQNVNSMDRVNTAKSIRFSSWFKTSTTTDLQPTELHTTEYFGKEMNVIKNGSGFLSHPVMNEIWAIEEIQLEIPNANISESHEQAEQFTKNCVPNESLAATVNDLQADEPVQDSLGNELASAHQDIREWEEELQIEKCHSVKMERWLNKCKSDPDATE